MSCYIKLPEVKQAKKLAKKKYLESEKGRTAARNYGKKYRNRLDVKEWLTSEEYKEYRKFFDKRRRESEDGKKYQREYAKTRASSDILFRLAGNLRSRIRFAIKAKKGSAVRDLGCTLPEFRVYLESLFQAGMSWSNYGNTRNCWSIDHIKPLTKFDLTIKEEFLKAVHYTNLQPMWHIENIKKGNKYNESNK